MITQDRIKELLAKARAANNIPTVYTQDERDIAFQNLHEVDAKGKPITTEAEFIQDALVVENTPITQGTGRTGEVITYNFKQQEIIDVGLKGESCILIGAAGTGKTTSTQAVFRSLINSGKIPTLEGNHKYLPSGKTPGIILISFTRRAVANAKRFAVKGMEENYITFHKLLEYEPVYYEVLDPSTGLMKKTMKFEPTRHQYHPLDESIKVVGIEEASMFSTEYWKQLKAALPHDVQFIFIGDIQQLPPVFGPAILGYKMLELPTVELTEVYRQALNSPIIRLAHRVLSGKEIPVKELETEWQFPQKLTIKYWKKKISADNALRMASIYFCGNAKDPNVIKDQSKLIRGFINDGSYNPMEDMILIPFNKSYGTDELNKYIAQDLAQKREADVYEVIAGYKKYYFSVGDRVLYDKEDAIIIDIKLNAVYAGKAPQPHSKTLDYWGVEHSKKANGELGEDEFDLMLDSYKSGDDEDRVRAASHVLTVRMQDSGIEVQLDSASAINGLIMSYALTVHKSQGSEWRKVFLLFHQSHATMIQRELLYTAITRAKEELFIICEAETFVEGIKRQRIKGNSLKEKAEYFKGKLESEGEY